MNIVFEIVCWIIALITAFVIPFSYILMLLSCILYHEVYIDGIYKLVRVKSKGYFWSCFGILMTSPFILGACLYFLPYPYKGVNFPYLCEFGVVIILLISAISFMMSMSYMIKGVFAKNNDFSEKETVPNVDLAFFQALLYLSFGLPILGIVPFFTLDYLLIVFI